MREGKGPRLLSQILPVQYIQNLYMLLLCSICVVHSHYIYQLYGCFPKTAFQSNGHVNLRGSRTMRSLAELHGHAASCSLFALSAKQGRLGPAAIGARLDIQERLLRRNMDRLRGGLVSKAHRLLYHSILGSRVIKKKRRLESMLPNHVLV